MLRVQGLSCCIHELRKKTGLPEILASFLLQYMTRIVACSLPMNLLISYCGGETVLLISVDLPTLLRLGVHGCICKTAVHAMRADKLLVIRGPVIGFPVWGPCIYTQCNPGSLHPLGVHTLSAVMHYTAAPAGCISEDAWPSEKNHRYEPNRHFRR